MNRVQEEMPEDLPIPGKSAWFLRRTEADGGNTTVRAHELYVSMDKTTFQFVEYVGSQWLAITTSPKEWSHGWRRRTVMIVRDFKSIEEVSRGGQDGSPE